jgi:predicted RNA-binding protein with TRAM domain
VERRVPIAVYNAAVRGVFIRSNILDGGKDRKGRFGMKTKGFVFGLSAMALIFALILAGCLLDMPPDDEDEDGNGDQDKVSPPSTYTTIDDNTWAVGDIIEAGGEQWYMFTAAADTQYIHASFGTLSSSYGLYVQLYNSAGVSISSRTNLDYNYRTISQSVTAGSVYYVKVQAYSSSDTGTFWIGVNTYSNWTPGSFPPANPIALTDNTWADGDITTAGGSQWFTFTATAGTQYIHAGFGTLRGSDGIYVQLYNKSGDSASSRTNLDNNTTTISLPVTTGTEYYVQVRAYSSSGTGTFWIGFNTYSNWNPGSFPPANPTVLEADAWAEGDIKTAGGSQWFTFTAAADTQYIHVSFGTLPGASMFGSAQGLYVQLYNSTGGSASSRTHLYGDTKYVSYPVTTGAMYYARVQGYSSNTGTYKIGFNTSETPPVSP